MTVRRGSLGFPGAKTAGNLHGLKAAEREPETLTPIILVLVTRRLLSSRLRSIKPVGDRIVATASSLSSIYRV
jgi:hypothetical protein